MYVEYTIPQTVHLQKRYFKITWLKSITILNGKSNEIIRTFLISLIHVE